MSVGDPHRFEASAELTQTILSKLATEKGIHAETAVSAAARMAGTLLLRSCRLPVANFKPGSPIFSDQVDELGPRVLESVDKALALLKIPIDTKKVKYDISNANQPLMKLLEMQSLLDPSFRMILQKHGLSDEEGAHAAAISAAVIIEKTKGVLNPYTAYAIVVEGLVAGSKTVPYDAGHPAVAE
jgi:hypothetical protein